MKEFLGNPTRSVRSFFSDRWPELDVHPPSLGDVCEIFAPSHLFERVIHKEGGLVHLNQYFDVLKNDLSSLERVALDRDKGKFVPYKGRDFKGDRDCKPR
ncbi:hypothetical protein RND71_034591 [Anisodus tanguticus]|uniref:Uncharacterized protein n=1 Tax=Anisodus tanguticus TaxID=243964 RepID=A0AAE1RCF5_9SOLA|nr:hypothetical protein RND71_034591 [Anisodus tanguticus]